MSSPFGADPRFGADEDEPRDLAQFEAALHRIIEERLVQSAQSPSEPTADEARQLARMAAHMEVTDLARRPRLLRPRAHTREVARATPTLAAGRGERGGVDAMPALGATNAPNKTTRPLPGQRRALLRTYVTLAAVALGVALVRGPASGPDLATPAVADLRARGPLMQGVGPQDEVYLSGEVADKAARGTEFPGRVTWDPRGQDGVVLVSVFDLDGDPREPVFKDQVEGSEWTPERSLPKRFRVVVDRPADDGVSREELYWKEYELP